MRKLGYWKRVRSNERRDQIFRIKDFDFTYENLYHDLDKEIKLFFKKWPELKEDAIEIMELLEDFMIEVATDKTLDGSARMEEE